MPHNDSLTRWCFDFDGCVIDSHGTLVDKINERNGTGYTRDMMTDLTDFWQHTVLKPHRDWAWGEYCFDRERFIQESTPLPGIVDLIQTLLTYRHPVFIVTDRPARHQPWIARFLAAHDIVVPVVLSEDYDLEKSKLLDDLNISIVAEDSPSQVLAYLANSNAQRVLLYTQPWNRRAPVVEPVERVYSWKDVTHRIMEEIADVRTRATVT